MVNLSLGLRDLKDRRVSMDEARGVDAAKHVKNDEEALLVEATALIAHSKRGKEREGIWLTFNTCLDALEVVVVE